jgi:hypothetical protein
VQTKWQCSVVYKSKPSRATAIDLVRIQYATSLAWV